MSKFSLDNLDKSTWEPFKFQEIAERIAITVDPTTTELEVYVGLEHIDAEDIHIRRFGKPSDVKGNKLKCFKDDVIFGKRRAYQRKAAIVDFDGICSAHSFVFRAKPNIIEPKLFPFFLHSDQFMHRAVDISVGGLSPTINWGDLKDEEFLLPPKEEQKKLAELLWAMDDVIEKEKKLLKTLELTLLLDRKLFFDTYSNSEIELSKIIYDQRFVSKESVPKSEILEEGIYPVIDQSSSFISGFNNNSNYVNENFPIILFGDHTTILKYIDFPFITGADGTKLIKPKIDMDLRFLYHQILYLNIKIEGYKRHFPILSRKKIKIMHKDDMAVKKFLDKVETIDKSIVLLKQKIDNSESVQKSLINQIF